MRTAPIGLFFAGQPDDLIDAAIAESAVTHFDPRCRLACAGYDAALAAAAYDHADRRTVAAAAVGAIDEAARRLVAREPGDAERTRAACLALRDDLRAADADDPDVYGDALHLHRHAGFVRVAFRLAFWHLLHTDSLEAALVDVANRGGDADTNCAIVGALLGAVVGEQGIPAAWREVVMSALADRPDDPLATNYHPRALLALAR
jgi:ADP-ribosyl-[dinitrogen reductase] hydrolase